MSPFCALQACGWCPLRPSCLRSALSFPQQAISTSAFLDYMGKLKYNALGGAILSFSIMISVSAQNRGGAKAAGLHDRGRASVLQRPGRRRETCVITYRVASPWVKISRRYTWALCTQNPFFWSPCVQWLKSALQRWVQVPVIEYTVHDCTLQSQVQNTRTF